MVCNSTLQEECTPLYYAAERGYNDVVKLLLAAKADPNCVCILSYYSKLYVSWLYKTFMYVMHTCIYRISVLHFTLLQPKASMMW